LRVAIERVLDGPFRERARAMADAIAAEQRDRLATEVENAIAEPSGS
jgi:hypothetical protein